MCLWQILIYHVWHLASHRLVEFFMPSYVKLYTHIQYVYYQFSCINDLKINYYKFIHSPLSLTLYYMISILSLTEGLDRILHMFVHADLKSVTTCLKEQVPEVSVIYWPWLAAFHWTSLWHCMHKFESILDDSVWSLIIVIWCCQIILARSPHVAPWQLLAFSGDFWYYILFVF